ncbi:MAG: tetratricopeptide repeat protein [Planctomycetaceae bacterium]|nr:tetratricopeptide repeat protein [Planctomycetaceae bacterium]
MTHEIDHAKTIFLRAIEGQSPDQWEAYLDGACGDDAPLRLRVAALLKAHQDLGSFRDESPAVAQTIDSRPAQEAPGTQIGPYKLLQQIGEGGMGTVFMAEQTHPVHRKVALKVIKPGMDSRQVIARFEAERQALAMMDHVNIARVLDAGATESGRPYFVMELVHGVPITRYCDDHHLTPRQRLELFVPVCQAIQHAHQKGIIHRDIKPSNVMVTLYDGQPVPKVIDFGVAKATEQKLTERTLFTQYGTLVGTLEYMSPEQAEMSALGVDTRSDIFSLGVLLYELLTGSTPLSRQRIREAAYGEILRMIKEEEAPKPSTRLSDSGEALASISAQRHMEPAKLAKLVRGELDWIVMKCLEKDRNRRYETASGFAADVQRYLNDESVQACPPSAWYRFRKFARRNKAGLGVAALTLFFIVLLGGGGGWAMRDRSARVEEVARDRAARQAKLNQEVEAALNEANAVRELALSLTDNPYQWEGTLAAAESALKRAEGLASQDEAALQSAVAQRLKVLRTDLDADRNDRRFVARFDEIRLEQSTVNPKVSRFIEEIAFTAFKDAFQAHYAMDLGAMPAAQVVGFIQERPKPIQEYLVAAFEESLAQAPQQEPQARKWLATVLESVDADPWRKRARKALAARHWQALEVLVKEPSAARQPPTFLLRLALALPREEPECLNLMRRIQQAHPADFWANHSLANVLHYRRNPQLDEAIRYYTGALAVRPRNPAAYVNLGNALRGKGDLAGAVSAFREATRYGGDYTAAYIRLEQTLRHAGAPDEAIAEFKAAAQAQPEDAWAHRALGYALIAKGLLDEAIPAFKHALRLEPAFAATRFGLGFALQRKGMLDEAISEHREAVRLNPMNADHHRELGIALTDKRLLDEAIAEFREALRLDPGNADTRSWLGIALGRKGLWDEAIAEFSKSLEQFPKDARYWNNRGGSYAELGQWKEALADFAKVSELKEDDPLPRYRQALACIQLEDVAGYRKLCADMLGQFGLEAKTESARWTVWTCVLAADAVTDWKVPLQLAEQAVADKPKNYRALNHHGAVLYRAGQYQAALKRLTEAEAAEQTDDKKLNAIAYNWLFLAMTQHRLGHAAEAEKWLKMALDEMDRPQPEKSQAAAIPWNRRLTLQLLRREAEELLKQE